MITTLSVKKFLRASTDGLKHVSLFVCLFACSRTYIYLLIVGGDDYCCIWSHSDTPNTVGHLWIRDRPIAEASTWQYTAFRRERHLCFRRVSNPQSQQASGRRPTPLTAGIALFWNMMRSEMCRMWRWRVTHGDRISSYFPEQQILVVSNFFQLCQYLSTEMFNFIRGL